MAYTVGQQLKDKATGEIVTITGIQPSTDGNETRYGLQYPDGGVVWMIESRMNEYATMGGVPWAWMISGVVVVGIIMAAKKRR